MTVIFINRFFYPDHSATSQSLSDLAFGLAALGHDIHVISSRLRYDAPAGVLPAAETISGVRIHRVWTSRRGRDILAKRMFDYATFHMSAAYELWRLARTGDTVVIKTDPPLLSVTAGFVCKLRGARAVNWLQDLFPEIASASLGQKSTLRFLLKGLQRLRDVSLRAAAMNVAIGELMAQRLRALEVRADRIRIVPNWADPGCIWPVEPSSNPFRQELGCGDALVVGYSGNLGRVHEIEAILGAMTILAGRGRPDGIPQVRVPIVWLFVGDGALMKKLKSEVARRGLDRVVFKPYQTKESLALSLSAADVHLVSLRPEFEGLVVPSKVYGIMAAGRPVLFTGDTDGEVARLIRRYGLGYALPPGDGEALARVLTDLAAQPALCRQIGERARNVFERAFDRATAVISWERVIGEVSR